MKITEEDIANVLLREFWFQSGICAIRTFCWGGWESDFIRITRSSYFHEFEIKLSLSDFRADFRKEGAKWKKGGSIWGQEYKNKHEQIKNGESPLATFSFVAPEGVLSPDIVPIYAGLYAVSHNLKNGWSRFELQCLKKPKRLSNPKKTEIEDFYKLANRMVARWTTGRLNMLDEREESFLKSPPNI